MAARHNIMKMIYEVVNKVHSQLFSTKEAAEKYMRHFTTTSGMNLCERLILDYEDIADTTTEKEEK